MRHWALNGASDPESGAVRSIIVQNSRLKHLHWCSSGL
jgi:hypothetical protein